MSKQFVKGNIYVFTKKKYLEDKRKSKKSSDIGTKDSLRLWVNSINGNKVTTDDKWSGFTGKMEMFVAPEWCKCIKNNNPKKMKARQYKWQMKLKRLNK